MARVQDEFERVISEYIEDGWNVLERSTAMTGSCYATFERGGIECRIRVADHGGHPWDLADHLIDVYSDRVKELRPMSPWSRAAGAKKLRTLRKQAAWANKFSAKCMK